MDTSPLVGPDDNDLLAMSFSGMDDLVPVRPSNPLMDNPAQSALRRTSTVVTKAQPYKVEHQQIKKQQQ